MATTATIALPAFPDLTRQLSLKTRQVAVDPTLRDPMENGMETTRARWTRMRREFDIAIDYLTTDDKALLEHFEQNTAVYGANAFLLTDPRSSENPQILTVRFASTITYVDAGWIQSDGVTGAGYRYNCTFKVREV